MRSLTLTFVFALALSGCNTARLADDVDFVFNFAPLILPSDELHTPYVAGASLRLYTIGVSNEDTERWRLASADPSVLRIDSTEDGDAEVTATGAGETIVTIHDARGDVVHTAPIDVRQADRAELLAHGPLIIGRPELQQEWDEIVILTGGSATFEVHWYDGQERLHGNGALSAVASGDIEVAPRQTFFFENREWVTFTPRTPGEYDVTLRANGVDVRSVRIVAVTEEAIDSAALHGMDESEARQGDPLAVYAQAYGFDGEPIFGVDYAWDLDGEEQEGLGDLFRYHLASGEVRMLGAQRDDLTAHAMIQARHGFVDSTNRLGCSVFAVGGPARVPSAAAVGLLALTLLRRRR